MLVSDLVSPLATQGDLTMRKDKEGEECMWEEEEAEWGWGEIIWMSGKRKEAGEVEGKVTRS